MLYFETLYDPRDPREIGPPEAVVVEYKTCTGVEILAIGANADAAQNLSVRYQLIYPYAAHGTWFRKPTLYKGSWRAYGSRTQ